MQRPPEIPENDPPDENDDDLVSKVYGPSQDDIDRSWEGYETGDRGSGRNLGGMIWKFALVIVSLVILTSMSIGILGPLFGGSGPSEPQPPQRVSATVLRVIDGRTIVVNTEDGEQTVRLIGVESPPFGDPFHHFAQEVTESWISGKDVLLEADELEGDEQGRLMRYMFFDDVMINAALIINGLGKLETEHPNIRYNDYLAEMERRARESGTGIWDESFGNLDADNTQASSHIRAPGITTG
jgi:micrococcal nuclease